MTLRTILRPDADKQRLLRHTVDDGVNYQSTHTAIPSSYQSSTTHRQTLTQTYMSSDLSSDTPPTLYEYNQSNDIPPSVLIPKPHLHKSSSLPFDFSPSKRTNTQTHEDIMYYDNTNHNFQHPSNLLSPYSPGLTATPFVDDIDAIDCLDDIDDIHDYNTIDSSSSASRSIYTNTPSMIPLVSAFRGLKFSSLNHIIVKPCSEKFDIAVLALTLSQILNYLSLKLFYPFAGYIYPMLNLSYSDYLIFIASSNLSTLSLVLIQPMLEYCPTHITLCILQVAIVASSALFTISSHLPTLILSRMILILCLNSIWLHSNGAIRSFTINNTVAHSRRNLILHSSWQCSSFLLAPVAMFWSEMSENVSLNSFSSVSAFHVVFLTLSLPTLICGLSYLWLVPKKALRIQYEDERLTELLRRTWTLIARDIAKIMRVKHVILLVCANVLAATSSMMMVFVLGLWLQKLLGLSVVGIGLFTLVQAASELCVVLISWDKCVGRRRSSVLACLMAIVPVLVMFVATYATVEDAGCDGLAGEGWLCALRIDGGRGNIVLVGCLFGVFYGHETLVTTVGACIFRACRRYNTPNAAYPLWNVIGCVGTVGGQVAAGLCWMYAGEGRSMLLVLLIMFVLDVVALCVVVYAFRVYRKK